MREVSGVRYGAGRAAGEITVESHCCDTQLSLPGHMIAMLTTGGGEDGHNH